MLFRSTYYLRQVLDELDGQAVVAAAAYNAGPGRARRWRDDKPLEGAIYAETIPFNETRDYAKKVMVNSVYYAAVFGQLRSLKARLGTVASTRGAPDAADSIASRRCDTRGAAAGVDAGGHDRVVPRRRRQPRRRRCVGGR